MSTPPFGALPMSPPPRVAQQIDPPRISVRALPPRDLDTAAPAPRCPCRSIAPGADIEFVENAGHFVHKDHPERFVKLLNDFVRTTEPASHDRADWREMLTHGPDSPAVRERAGQRPLRPVARLSRRR